MRSLVKQYSILSKRLNERVDRTCDKPSYRKFTEEIRSVIGNGLITCGEVKVNSHPPRGELGSEDYARYQMEMKLMERNYYGCFVFNADTNHLEESAIHDWEESVADSINELMEGRFSGYSVSANPIVMDSNGNDWDFFDIPDASWEAGFYAKHLHFTDKKAFFQDTGSLCSADEDLATREDFLNKINELREAGGQLAMMIAITAEA